MNLKKELIVEILSDWNFWRKDIDTGIQRNHYLEKILKFIKSNKVISIIGVRRSGKSTLINQIARILIQKGIPKNDILIVNFEEPQFEGVDVKSLLKIYEAYLEILNPTDKPFIFFDEIQNVKGWEKFEIFQLSFQEFLHFKGLKINGTKNELLLNAASIKKYLRDYMQNGGFPEVVLNEDKEFKRKVLISYYEDIVNRDIVNRFRISKIEQIKAIARFYLTNIASPISFNSVSRFNKLPVETVRRFSTYLETSYLIFFVKRFSYSVKEQENSPRKVYSIDTGLSNTIGFRFSKDTGRLAENIVALGLKILQSDNPNIEIYYWKNHYGNKEVDFVVKESERISQLIQVCWDIGEERVRKREIDSIFKAMSEFKLNKGIIITADYEDEEIVKNRKILYIPLWKWLCNVKNEKNRG
ncbi:MAG: ATP-binding protein [bacterium]